MVLGPAGFSKAPESPADHHSIAGYRKPLEKEVGGRNPIRL